MSEMKRIAITGAKGTIGTMLIKGLANYQLTLMDLPEFDILNYEMLVNKLKGHDTLIHLAWNRQENFRSKQTHPDNIMMFQNAYRAALETGTRRVIMASSIHINDFHKLTGTELLTPDTVTWPDSPYGATKAYMEALGRYYAQQGLQVICIRFGGINPADTPTLDEADYEKIWLSHRDCIELVKRCIEAPKVPNNFVAIYGVSNNAGWSQGYSNPFGWVPKDNSATRQKKQP